MSETNTAETIADLARQQAVAHIVQSADGREFLIIPDGMTKYDVPDEHGLTRTPPSYLKQSVTLQATDSLGDYVNRFKIADTVLFADIAASSITAVLDFHAASKGDVGPAAKRGVHRATMQLPFSEEWNIWKGISGNLKPQLEFARFLEENGGDVVAPGGAELLEACRDLQANRKVNFIQAVRTSSENENFEYTDETEARTRGGPGAAYQVSSSRSRSTSASRPARSTHSFAGNSMKASSTSVSNSIGRSTFGRRSSNRSCSRSGMLRAVPWCSARRPEPPCPGSLTARCPIATASCASALGRWRRGGWPDASSAAAVGRQSRPMPTTARLTVKRNARAPARCGLRWQPLAGTWIAHDPLPPPRRDFPPDRG
jgi:uncharacterized protein YfdQ (DUF2303 family)